ncbi:tetratricopeptide repeat protein [Halieaceae bacterium]|nr:tetratricopeptide repeat protein [Halieaceae bacterium]
MESYRTEEEQLEALKRWWDENGRSTLAAIVLALIAGFGWQAYKDFDQRQRETASDLYQVMLDAMSVQEGRDADAANARQIASQLKTEYGGSTYAQFAALHLARMAVVDGDLPGAEAELRWVLTKADSGSDIAAVAGLRLARVLAASGDTEQALVILAGGEGGTYAASYALARGDVLLGLGQNDQARAAYSEARALAASKGTQAQLLTLEQKLESLSPIPPGEAVSSIISSPPTGDEATDGEG